MFNYRLCILVCLWPLIGQSQVFDNACLKNTKVKIVVLGSSTAAGSGPSHPDSTWVNRYRKYLKTLNDSNEVINLAIGGTTTYHILPDWFNPPIGRPLPNPNNNISEALRLNADAVIVNMPSNDAANNYNTTEQLANFQSIHNTADSSSIPVWICTTQPRNGFSPSQIQTQLNVKDSILYIYGNNAIDFWNGFVNSANTLDPNFDSGDGVHMNDTAHGLLANRVINKNIPSLFSDTLAIYDQTLFNMDVILESVCGDSLVEISTIIGNPGIQHVGNSTLYLEIQDLINNSTLTDSLTFSTLNSCQIDTLFFQHAFNQSGDFKVRTYFKNKDSVINNDTSEYFDIKIIGKPLISNLTDSSCMGEDVYLKAISNSLIDYVLWFDSSLNGNLLNISDSLYVPMASGSEIYYSKSVRGPLYFESILETTQQTTTNWNGIMFDISAKDSLVIDSIYQNIQSTGNQIINVYFKQGSYSGSENVPGDWILISVDTINVNANEKFYSISIPAIPVSQSDTIAFYIHMDNSTANLSYLNTGSNLVYEDSILSIPSASGISYTFGTIYNPRNWSGRLYYHYGFNPDGYCSSNLIQVGPKISNPKPFLGKDTILNQNQDITLSPNANYDTYYWNTGDSTNNLLIQYSDYGPGTHLFWLEVTNQFDCLGRDSINIIYDLNRIKSNNVIQVNSIYPNPAKDFLYFNGDNKRLFVQLYNEEGKLCLSQDLENGILELKNIASGIYTVIINKDYSSSRKLIVLDH